MEYIKVTLRRHPLAGWGFVVITGISMLFAAINQISGGLKALGIIK